MLEHLKHKRTQILILISCSLILFSYPIIFSAPPLGQNWDLGFSTNTSTQGKIFYGLGESINDFSMQADRVIYSHETGDWGLSFYGGNSTLTHFSNITNSYITELNVSSIEGTHNNQTVFYPPIAFQPKFVDISNNVSTTRIVQANFKLDINAFDATDPPVVYWDPTTSEVIAKGNQSSEFIIFEFSFQENPIVPDVLTVLPNNQFEVNFVFMGVVLSILIALIFTIVVIRRKRD